MAQQTKSSIEKLLATKKQKSNTQNNRQAKPAEQIGERRKAIKQKRGGGLFDGK